MKYPLNNSKFSIPKDYVYSSLDYLENVMPIEVCHYTKMTTALENILKDKKILFNDVTSTNDPKESKGRLFYFQKLGPINGVVPILNNDQNEWFRKILKECRVLCTSCHHNPLSSFMNGTIELRYSNMGYSAMWAHYADNHKGICLLFDGVMLNKNIQKSIENEHRAVLHGFVDYNLEKSTTHTIIDDSDFREFDRTENTRRSLIKHYKNNFFVKSPEWKIEHEFRWLIFTQDKSEILVSIEKTLKAVIAGEDLDHVYIPSLKALCEPLEIPLGKMSWLDGKPYVDWIN